MLPVLCTAFSLSPMSAFAISLLLGLVAALADVLGGLILVRANWPRRYLRYFVALGAGFMLAAAFLEMIPESFRLSFRWTPMLVFGGYCAIHLLEHTITPHFHFGEETHRDEFLSRATGNSVVGGLAVHSLFDGVAIASGFVLSNWLGWVIFIAIFLHKMPEGFTVASVMLASGRGRARRAALRRRRRFRHAGRHLSHQLAARLGARRPAALRRRGHLCCRHRPCSRGQPRARHSHGSGLLWRRRALPALRAFRSRALLPRHERDESRHFESSQNCAGEML